MDPGGEYDLIVCGAGPAGTAAAITAKRNSPNARVLLIEAGNYPRHKVCGEFFSPEAVGVLGSLLGKQHPLFQAAVPIDRVGLHVRRWSTSFALRQSALSLTRRELDAALWQRARQIGIEAIDRTRVQRIERSNGASFHVATAERSYVAKSVVNATGRWSELRSDLKHRTNFIGIKAHWETGRAVDPVCDLHFFQGGYVGIQPISRTSVNVSALVDASQFRDMESVFAAAGLAEVARDWQPLFPAITCPLVKHEAPEPLCDGVLQCGDAAAFLDPFAGDGMSLALHSGVLAGDCIASVESYASLYKQAFSRTFRTASLLRKFVFAPHWLQSVGLQMMRVPWIAQLAITNTRAGR